MSTLYRTNSFTGNDNPVKLTSEMLADDKHQADIMAFLYNNILPYFQNQKLAADVRDMTFADGADKLADFMKQDREYRLRFYERIVKEIEITRNVKLTYACWFSNKAVVMSRSKGYGLNLCKEDGILKCSEPYFVLLIKGFDILACFETFPKFSQDIITNKTLISREQLNELLSLEKTYGKLLAETCLKKDVLNVLKRAQMGLLDKDYSAVIPQQEAESTRERDLQDLL